MKKDEPFNQVSFPLILFRIQISSTHASSGCQPATTIRTATAIRTQAAQYGLNSTRTPPPHSIQTNETFQEKHKSKKLFSIS
jgi:hypothetical protein